MLITEVKLKLKSEKKEEDKETTVRYPKPNDDQLEIVNNALNDKVKDYLANNEDNPRSCLEAFIKYLGDSAEITCRD